MTYYDPTTGQGAAAAASVPPCQRLTINSLAAPDPASKKAAPDAEPPKGTWFDEAYDLRDPEGHALTIAALAFLPSPTRADHRASLYHRTRCILANGLRCHYHRSPAWVTYSRKADARCYLDSPPWYNGKAMAQTIDALTEARLLKSNLGKEKQAASTYHLTPALLKIASQQGVAVDSLTYRMRSERRVRIYVGNSKSEPIAFDWTEEIARWVADLENYRDFLGQHAISLPLTPAERKEWADRANRKRRDKWNNEPSWGGLDYIRPELDASKNLWRLAA